MWTRQEGRAAAALAPPTPDGLSEPELDADCLGAVAMEELFET